MAEYTTHSGTTFNAPDLLPCPCCGGKAELEFKGNDYTKKRSVTIKCKSCKLQRTDAAIRNTAQWCAEVAIDQWNARGQKAETKNANCAIFDVSNQRGLLIAFADAWNSCDASLIEYDYIDKYLDSN